MEKRLDLKVMQTLIGLYKEIAEQINIHGEETIRMHSPELIERRDILESYVVNYAQHFYKGLAYAEHMDISEIEEAISRN